MNLPLQLFYTGLVVAFVGVVIGVTWLRSDLAQVLSKCTYGGGLLLCVGAALLGIWA